MPVPPLSLPPLSPRDHRELFQRSARSLSMDGVALAETAQPLVWFCSTADDDLRQDSPCWTDVLSRLTEEERTKINRFHSHADRQRAMVSVMLQRAAIHETYGYKSIDQYKIRRTPSGKPYFFDSRRETGWWNYNVSHHGDFVGILAHHCALVGMDIVDTKQRSTTPCSAHEYIGKFSSLFSRAEIQRMLCEKTEDDRYSMFYLHWSLKEAFIKAVGKGLQIDLDILEFSVAISSQEQGNVRGTATLKVNGVARPDWCFEFFSLDDRHVASLAEGPCEDSEISFQEGAWKEIHFIQPLVPLKKNINQPTQAHLQVREPSDLPEKKEFMSFQTLCRKVFPKMIH